jgi:hypothetical protein
MSRIERVAPFRTERSSPIRMKELRRETRNEVVYPVATAAGTGGDSTRRHGPSRNGAGPLGPVE